MDPGADPCNWGPRIGTLAQLDRPTHFPIRRLTSGSKLIISNPYTPQRAPPATIREFRIGHNRSRHDAHPPTMGPFSLNSLISRLRVSPAPRAIASSTPATATTTASSSRTTSMAMVASRQFATTPCATAKAGGGGGKGKPSSGKGKPSSGNKPGKKKKKDKGAQPDPRINNLKLSMPRKVPAPLRFGRNRHLRHWTIHRAWLLWQRQEREREENELMRLVSLTHYTDARSEWRKKKLTRSTKECTSPWPRRPRSSGRRPAPARETRDTCTASPWRRRGCSDTMRSRSSTRGHRRKRRRGLPGITSGSGSNRRNSAGELDLVKGAASGTSMLHQAEKEISGVSCSDGQ